MNLLAHRLPERGVGNSFPERDLEAAHQGERQPELAVQPPSWVDDEAHNLASNNSLFRMTSSKLLA